MQKLSLSSGILLLSLVSACSSNAGTSAAVSGAIGAGHGAAAAAGFTGAPTTNAGSVAIPPPPALAAGIGATVATAGSTAPAITGSSGSTASSADSGVVTNAGQGAAGTPAAASGDDAGVDLDSDDAGSMPVGTPTQPPAVTTGPFPSVSDFTKPGPYSTTTLDNTGPNANYTVYLPTQLAPNGAKNPIVGWMSGGATFPALYPLLPHLASHGFVVVASNTVPGTGDEMSLGQEIIAGIDWAIAENTRQGSQLFGKLDTTKLASVGYSMGSLATFTIANDPRLTTTVHISGGNMVTDRVNNLHAPAAFLCGTPDPNCTDILSDACDIAASNCDTDFQNAKTPVFYGNFPGGHLGILTPPNQDRLHAEIAAWLRWQLMADGTLKTRFVGPACTVCKDSNWKVQQKNLQ